MKCTALPGPRQAYKCGGAELARGYKAQSNQSPRQMGIIAQTLSIAARRVASPHKRERPSSTTAASLEGALRVRKLRRAPGVGNQSWNSISDVAAPAHPTSAHPATHKDRDPKASSGPRRIATMIKLTTWIFASVRLWGSTGAEPTSSGASSPDMLIQVSA